MRFFETCHLFYYLVSYAFIANNFRISTTIIIITVDNLVVNVLEVWPVSLLMVLNIRFHQTSRLLVFFDIILAMSVSRTLTIKLALLGVDIAGRDSIWWGTWNASIALSILFRSPIEKRLLHIPSQRVAFPCYQTIRVNYQLILWMKPLCCICTASTTVKIVCSCTQLLLKDAYFKANLLLRQHTKGIFSRTKVEIKLIDVNPGCCRRLLTFTHH